MRLTDPDRDFIIVGENVHTTRVVMRKGKLVSEKDDGSAVVRYTTFDGDKRQLPISESAKKTQDYEEGRVKHIKVAVQAAMSGDAASASDGAEYLKRQIQKQVEAGADYLDVNVDEISIKLEDQLAAMDWLVRFVQRETDVPVSVDSSNIDVIRSGLQAWDASGGRPMLNSASLERLDALDLAVEYKARVIVTAAGESGMPSNTEERVTNASRMVDSGLDRGLALDDLFVDPLIFPISVDGRFGPHSLDAIRTLREKYGEEIHITGGFSNVSFGIPSRKWINDVFIMLAVEAGADSGIIDPVGSKPAEIFKIDRDSTPYKLSEDAIMGRDEHCANYLTAWRRGDLGDGGPPQRKRRPRPLPRTPA
jgi:cobalamin-dependent methionine synthase I